MEKLINRTVFISMLFIGLTLLGYFAYRLLPVELYPSTEMPTLGVNISCNAKSNIDYIKNKAVIPVEGVVSSMANVEEIKTQISPNGAQIEISMKQSTDIKFAFLQLEEKIKQLSQSLPDDIRATVNKQGTSGVNTMFMNIQILGSDNIDALRDIAEKDIVPKLENVEGVATVKVMGGRSSGIEILYDPYKCQALNLTPGRITSLIQQNNEERSFVGSVYDNKNEYFVNVAAEYLQPEDLGSIVVSKGPTQLSDIADIHFGLKDQENYSRVNGKEVISATIARTPLSNVIDISKNVRDEIANLNKEFADKDISILIDSDVAETMNKNIDTILNLGLVGAILAIFILYLFLRNFRIVSFIAFAIPISIAAGFFIFYLFHISINLLTLTGIALAIGMLLDNSIVVLENIFRLRAVGLSSEEASVKGTKEVRRSIIASTLTTIMVFIPFMFTDNFFLKLIGKNVGIAIITTLSISLIVALLLIPMAVNFFMKKQKVEINFNRIDLHNKGVQFYLALLKMALRRPVILTVSMLLLLVGSIVIALTVSTNTLKEIESDSFNLYATFRSNSTLDNSDQKIRNLEEELQGIDEIEKFSSNVYATDASINIKLKKNYKDIHNSNLAEIKNIILEKSNKFGFESISLEALESSDNFKGGGGDALMGGSSKLLEQMGVGNQSEEIIIKGQDFEEMQNFAEVLQSQISDLENISYAYTNTSSRSSEAQLYFNQYAMGTNDITPGNVNTELRSFNPQNNTSTTFKTEDEEYDIIIKDKIAEENRIAQQDNDASQRTLQDLNNLYVDNTKNVPISLRVFSNVRLAKGMSRINRVNQDNQIIIKYRFNQEINESKSVLESARAEIDDVVASALIPNGVAVEVVHETNDTNDYTFLILAACALIFMILASVFESLTAPIILMFAIPLAAIGSLIALILTENALLNANVLIGFIILIGIVVNNSIILIDYTSLLRRQGNRKVRALITAGLYRLRPILITAVTTIFAMLPLAMGKGEFVSGIGSSFAITVIGGLISSTLLTLIVIPTLYSGLEDALKRLREESTLIKITQIVILAATLGCIYKYETNILIASGYIVLSMILIPGITWFIQSSLKQANSKIIPDDEPIHISISNLVKIYGRPSEFSRELISGENRRRRRGLSPDTSTQWKHSFWLVIIPVTGFLFYFSFIFQESTLWATIGSFCFWLALIAMVNELKRISFYRHYSKRTLIFSSILKIIRYVVPFILLIAIHTSNKSDSGTVLLGLIWYLLLTIQYINIHKKAISTDKSKSKIATLKKSLLAHFQNIPIIGIKTPPFRALNAVSLNIQPGMFGLLGPNGAGKTTLMRIICGIFEQSYGKIYINNFDTQKFREELQGIIGYLPQEFGCYENLSAWDYLEYQALLKGIYNPKTRDRRITEVLEAVHMLERKNDKIEGFSGGMKQRIGIAQTLLHLPRILVVDEPTAGLDPRERIRFRNLLVELSKNRIVIFSTHIIEDIASSCNQVGIINKGEVKFHGSPADMLAIANNVTWSFEVPATEFHNVTENLLIVHHIRKGDKIQVRCLSEEAPTSNATRVQPLLEDAYLWLLRNVKIKNKEKIITQ